MAHQIIESNNKMKKIIIILLILGAGAGSYGYYLYNKPRAGASDMRTAYVVDAKDFFAEYSSDENAANAKYLGKAVEVTGTIRSIETDDRGTRNIAIETGDMGAVSCQFEKKDQMPSMTAGSRIRVKGVCSGLLLDVVLVDSEIIIENNSSK